MWQLRIERALTACSGIIDNLHNLNAKLSCQRNRWSSLGIRGKEVHAIIRAMRMWRILFYIMCKVLDCLRKM